LQQEIWDWRFDEISVIGGDEAWEVFELREPPAPCPSYEVMERVCIASMEVVGLALVRYRVENVCLLLNDSPPSRNRG
jgi:hypothetical protein